MVGYYTFFFTERKRYSLSWLKKALVQPLLPTLHKRKCCNCATPCFSYFPPSYNAVGGPGSTNTRQCDLWKHGFCSYICTYDFSRIIPLSGGLVEKHHVVCFLIQQICTAALCALTKSELIVMSFEKAQSLLAPPRRSRAASFKSSIQPARDLATSVSSPEEVAFTWVQVRDSNSGPETCYVY